MNMREILFEENRAMWVHRHYPGQHNWHVWAWLNHHIKEQGGNRTMSEAVRRLMQDATIITVRTKE